MERLRLGFVVWLCLCGGCVVIGYSGLCVGWLLCVIGVRV